MAHDIDHTYPLDLTQENPWRYEGPVGGHVDLGNGFMLAFYREEPEEVADDGGEFEYRARVVLYHGETRLDSDYQADENEPSNADFETMFREIAEELLSTNWTDMQKRAGISVAENTDD